MNPQTPDPHSSPQLPNPKAGSGSESESESDSEGDGEEAVEAPPSSRRDVSHGEEADSEHESEHEIERGASGDEAALALAAAVETVNVVLPEGCTTFDEEEGDSSGEEEGGGEPAVEVSRAAATGDVASIAVSEEEEESRAGAGPKLEALVTVAPPSAAKPVHPHP